jgi:UDP-N-acetylglucosamine 2-epimerase
MITYPGIWIPVSRLFLWAGLSALSLVDVFAGNSSSGIIEAPFFQIPAINIGNRQKGRIKMESVIDVDGSFESINNAFAKVLSGRLEKSCRTLHCPYGDGTAAIRIVDVLKSAEISLSTKDFFDITFNVQNG